MAAPTAVCLLLTLAHGPAARAGSRDIQTLIEQAKPELAPIDLAEPPGAWVELFSALAGSQPIFSAFTEIRRFPFKKSVVKLKGEMRFSRELGLSLHYEEPAPRTLIVDAKGIMMRDGRGRTRSFRGDRRGVPAPVALLPIMGFDLPRIAEHFNVRGARTDGLWWLEFVPRNETLDTRVEAIHVAGEGAEVKHLAFTQESGQHVQIIIETTQTRVVFSEDDARRWFR